MNIADITRVLGLAELGISLITRLYDTIKDLRDNGEFTEEQRVDIDSKIAELRAKFEGL